MWSNHRSVDGTASTVGENPRITVAVLMVFARWNATVFASIPFVMYPIAVATSDFATASDRWNNTWVRPSENHQIAVLKEESKTFSRLENPECIERYISPLQTTSALIMVSNKTTLSNDGSSLATSWMSSVDGVDWDRATNWMCPESQRWIQVGVCTLDNTLPYANNWVIAGWIDGVQTNWTIEYCLAGEAGDNAKRCGLHFNVRVLLIVFISMLAETLLICWTAWRHNGPTILTIGDAIAEFLREADTTRSQDDRTSSSRLNCPRIARLRFGHWRLDNSMWFKAVSSRTWILSSVL